MSGLRLRPGDRERIDRMRRQGVDVAVDAEALTDADDEGAGESEVQRTADEAEHGDDCNCGTCSCDGDDCGAWDAEVAKSARFRRGALITRSGVRYRARRFTRHGAEPGRDVDDWEPAPAAPPARASTKARGVPQWVKLVVEEVRAWGRETFAPLARLDALERKVAELETKSGATAEATALADAYCGPHVDARDYRRGQLVTHGGSLWLCMTGTRSRPGKDSDWRLVVKHGRDCK